MCPVASALAESRSIRPRPRAPATAGEGCWRACTFAACGEAGPLRHSDNATVCNERSFAYLS